MARSQYLTASEAAAELGVSLPTLYSYVSRGFIRSEATGSTKRERRYYQEDVQKLKDLKEQRRNPAKAAEQALYWGAPVLESGLTLISNGRLYYRGQDALQLARDYSIEQVAGLLWLGDLNTDLDKLFCRAGEIGIPPLLSANEHNGNISLVEAFQIVLSLALSDDPGAYDLRSMAVAQTGARILCLLTRVATGMAGPVGAGTPGGLAQSLQQGWAPQNPSAASLFNTALILCADHELNVSSFTARCVASAGSTPYAVINAGIAALQGTKHGGHVERVEALFREAGTPGNAGRVLTNRLKRGEKIPGFGHPLYPEGDPRGRLLIHITEKAFPNSPAVALSRAVVDEAAKLIGEKPTLDLGLVVLSRALGLQPGAALALFALGRTVGWIAHAIEQYQSDQLIRPRARYSGPRPQT